MNEMKKKSMKMPLQNMPSRRRLEIRMSMTLEVRQEVAKGQVKKTLALAIQIA